jgi:hypothetical protein
MMEPAGYWLKAPEIDRVRETVDVLRKFLGGDKGIVYLLSFTRRAWALTEHRESQGLNEA